MLWRDGERNPSSTGALYIPVPLPSYSVLSFVSCATAPCERSGYTLLLERASSVLTPCCTVVAVIQNTSVVGYHYVAFIFVQADGERDIVILSFFLGILFYLVGSE